MAERTKITIKGIVQGVGFRPYVFNLAESLHLKGYVTNTSEGVTIDIEGEDLAAFINRLPKESPPLSRIAEIAITPLPACGYDGFRILESEDDGSSKPFTLISPDVSVCADCLRELLDHNDRRHLYPFINCTNCGPRYTITKSIPYDRPSTTMSFFEMCPECSEEYHNPKDRRFHAQPNACSKCGPEVKFEILNTKFNPSPTPLPQGEGVSGRVEGENPIEGAIRLLRGGAIVAIKGLGGFHIACDAANDEAVKRLRDRKRKSNKPFALMAPDVETIESYCEVSGDERRLLVSNRRPIVLLKKRKDGEFSLSEAVSPRNQYLGFMLPYTPLHYLLFYFPLSRSVTSNVIVHPHPNPPPSPHSGGFAGAKRGREAFNAHFSALVMTSGNLSEEPIVRDNDEAAVKLSGLMDAGLFHNRDIFMRVDDSVVRVTSNELRVTSRETNPISTFFAENPPSPPFAKEGQEGILNSSLVTRHSSLSFIRRSRGYAPDPIALYSDGPEVMGCGADLKNTFTVTKGGFAIPSQHIGDMENYETLRFFEECLENIKGMYRAEPVALGCDLHPGYLSTQWAMKQDLPKFPIQHHYAHIGSVMAERGLCGKVIGVALDGTGYGADGSLWGGEFLVADMEGFERAGHFRYVSLPGGESAIREPWRMGVSYVLDAAGGEAFELLKTIGFTEKYGDERIEKVIKVAGSSELSPPASGAGRLFDAVSALIGLCDRNTFEGEAAMILESVIKRGTDQDYPVNIKIGEKVLIDFSPTIIEILRDASNKAGMDVISAKFHNTVVRVIVTGAMRLGGAYGLEDVVLSGGTFQNMYLLGKTMEKLSSAGMNVFTNSVVPCNDACISLGQAYIVRERLKRGKIA